MLIRFCNVAIELKNKKNILVRKKAKLAVLIIMSQRPR